jgi:hypothetical protein
MEMLRDEVLGYRSYDMSQPERQLPGGCPCIYGGGQLAILE